MNGFKSFGKKSTLEFSTPITAVVGPNGSGKSNAAEAFRFVLGEQSMKSLRGKRGEDLIWGGSTEVPRSNRASVKAVFNNAPKDGKRLLDIDYDEVEIERVVYRDGVNEYLVNGSKVRLKDVLSLLAGANIGYSGHHIISQGEADRIISATPHDRRSMIEDALGLRVYQHKKDESLKKLEKTGENRNQVEALRKENIPHLRFLERQVKKIEKARLLREDLVVLYHEYLKREETYLQYEKETIDTLKEEPSRVIKEVTQRIEEVRDILNKTKGDDTEIQKISTLEQELANIRDEKTKRSRDIGRIEGHIAFEERRIEEEKKKVSEEEGKPIPYSEVKKFWEEVSTEIPDDYEDLEENDLIKVVTKVRKALQDFITHHAVDSTAYVPDRKTLEHLQKEKEEIEKHVQVLQEKVDAQEEEVRAHTAEIEKEKDKNRDLERERYALMTKESSLRATLNELRAREVALQRDEDAFKQEISEGIALIGGDVQGYKTYDLGEQDIDRTEDRNVQYERKRKLEKTKIRLEELGGASTDEVMREYKEVKERDKFLEKELIDLEQSEESLKKIITDLDHELNEKFKAGLANISKQFNDFFVLMFDGGSASLLETKEHVKQKEDIFTTDEAGIEDEEEEKKAGIDIQVSLPKKRIQSLMMLSGGERALTSIALIFAMSQVNPPPFLILDETDAALDEANSRRYGDMIRNLSQRSQLILITHNRETMSRANVLYGITMSIDGVSRILSVQFDDAVAVAK